MWWFIHLAATLEDPGSNHQPNLGKHMLGCDPTICKGIMAEFFIFMVNERTLIQGLYLWGVEIGKENKINEFNYFIKCVVNGLVEHINNDSNCCSSICHL